MVLAAVAALVVASTSAVAQTQRTTRKGFAVTLGTTPVGKVLVGARDDALRLPG